MNCFDYEMTVYDYYKDKGYEIQDVTYDRNYFDKDIDFILTLKNGKQKTIEVKTDSWIGTTKNVCIELKHYYDNGTVKPGWIHYCQADWLLYCCSQNNVCYVIRMDCLQDYLIENWNSPEWNIKYSKDKHKRTKCLLLSLDELEEACCISRKIDFPKKHERRKQ